MTTQSVATQQLASAGEASQLFSDVLPWLVVLIAFVVVGGIALYLIRRQINASSRDAAEPFTLEGLRQMRAEGLITDEEFEQARSAMIGRLTGRAADAGDSGEKPDATSGETGDNEPKGNGPQNGESGNGQTDRN